MNGSENKLSKKEFDELAKELTEICKSKGITKLVEIEALINEISRNAKLNDLIGDENND